MKIHKLAVAGLAAGIMIAGLGLAQNQSAMSSAAQGGSTLTAGGESPAVRSQAGVSDLEPVHGLAPIEEVVALWAERSVGQPLDYLNRTQLGLALATQARESADLAGYGAAEVAFREALDANPDYPSARLGLASALQAQHRFSEARAIATTVFAERPSLLGALALTGDADFELGDYDKAATAYFELAAAERSAPVVSRLARLASVRGDNSGAVDLAAEALVLSERLALRPSAAGFYHFQLAHFQFAAGDSSGAIVALNNALAIDPTSPGATEKLAAVLSATGHVEEALELYLELIEMGAAPDLHGAAADLHLLLGQDADAEEQELLGLKLAAETMDEFPAERRHLVGFLLTRDRAAALALAEADFIERRDVGAYDTLAWALHHNGRSAEAAEMIEAALAAGTRSASLYYHAAAISAEVGDSVQAVAYLDQAFEINPQFDVFEASDAAELRDRLVGSR